MIFIDRSLQEMMQRPECKVLNAHEERVAMVEREALEIRLWTHLWAILPKGFTPSGFDVDDQEVWQNLRKLSVKDKRVRSHFIDNARNVQRYLVERLNVELDYVSCREKRCKHKNCVMFIARTQRADLLKFYKELEACRKRIAMHNVRLILSISRKYAHNLKHLHSNDLFQEATFGLYKAAERYDPSKGFKFSTYAMWWIRHALTRAKQDQDRPIRVPVHQDDRARILRKLKIKYMQAHDGKEPTIEQLFEMEGHHARTTPKAIQQFLESQALYFVSLDAPINNKFDGDSQQLADILPVDQSSEQEEERVKVMRQVLDEVLVKLPDREREILMARFGLVDGQEMTLQEIGTRDNLSRERIRQVQEKALKHLHAYLARRGITRISAVA